MTKTEIELILGNKKLILGSSSFFRKAILEKTGIPFDVVAPNIDEKSIRTMDPLHTPVVISYAKAIAVENQTPNHGIVIACDQVIICKKILLEKPESPNQVREWYKDYEKNPVWYVNGITVLNTRTNKFLTGQEITVAQFQKIPPEFIEEQINEGTILNCCGAIGDKTEDLYSKIISGSKESTIGLPLDYIMRMVKQIV